MQWLVVLESMEKPVCKLCFPTLLPQPLQMLFLTSLSLLGIPCHQGRGSVPAPAPQCGAGCAQQDGLNARASCPAAASGPRAATCELICQQASCENLNDKLKTFS